jgi:GNAT superfamily N-acetyltransferase
MQIDGASPDGLAEELRAGAWQQGVEVHLMTGEVAHALRAMPSAITEVTRLGLDLRLADAPDDAWYACYLGGPEPIAAAGRQVVEQHPAAIFASLREGERAVAVARAAVDARWVGLFAVAVAPQHRRQGLGAAITLATLKAAAGHGGRHVYLQVETSNLAAVALYERLNLRTHHDYRYWTPS